MPATVRRALNMVLSAGANGDVIKSAPVNHLGTAATRIMYLSRNTAGQRIAVTGTARG